MSQQTFEEWNREDRDFVEEINGTFSIRQGFERIKSKFFLFLFLFSIK